jgi:hypothetical protein
MRRWKLISLTIVTLLVFIPSYAGDRLGIGVKAGTLGLGVDLTGRVNNWFAVRGSINAIDVSRSYNDTDIDYDADLTLGAFGVLLDFHPLRGNFRLTAGLMKNRNQVDLRARPTNDIDIGVTTYMPAQVGTLRGKIEFKDTAPYFGIGYGDAAKGPGRIKFLLDAGVMQQGSGKVSLRASSGQVAQSDLRQEESDIEDDISSYKLWPVLAMGVSFRI